MNNVIQYLEHALTTKRPADSFAEAKYAADIVKHLGDKVTAIDGSGNIFCDLRQGKSRTIFSSHLDSCARTDTGPNIITKTSTHYEATDDVLGADDGAGTALLLHLIDHGVPGMFILCRGEEIGGVGSTYIAEHFPDLLRQFDRAIAFDRAGTDEVIMRMCVGETASTEFAQAVSDALNDQNDNFMYSPSDRGSFTDVANWIEQIPECVNIGVGYCHQHSSKETLDIAHFNTLAQAITLIDWEALPVCRVAEVKRRWSSTPATSVLNTGYGDLQEMFEEAVYAAEEGDPSPLLDMAAEWAFPDDPAAALKTMNARRLTDEIIRNIRYCDAETGLETIYEELAVQ